MGHETLTRKAKALRAMHRAGRPLVLPNVWDAASAKALARAGFSAVATSSGAVAAALGWPDHEAAPVDEVFRALARVTRVVDVPVTADVEAGFGLSADDLVERLLSAEAVGCNLEDSNPHTGALVDPQAQARRLSDMREAATRAGVPLVINARVDVWIHGAGTREKRLAEGLRRARLYRAAGADCVYPIGLGDLDDLAAFVHGVEGTAVNAMAFARAPSLAALAGVGVARISFATSLFRYVAECLDERLAGIRAEAAALGPQSLAPPERRA
jgi:2-methylisocitrate lyase-like PEP mutase family enzyme